MERRKMLTAVIIAAVVGTLLNIINNADILVNPEPLSRKIYLKVILTYITPFCVSMLSSTIAQRNQDQRN